jgi:hypothetical protein
MGRIDVRRMKAMAYRVRLLRGIGKISNSKQRWKMQRRKFSHEFKIEAVVDPAQLLQAVLAHLAPHAVERGPQEVHV